MILVIAAIIVLSDSSAEEVLSLSSNLIFITLILIARSLQQQKRLLDEFTTRRENDELMEKLSNLAMYDKLGHDVGNPYLINVVNVIRERLRKYDAILRYGGDEFMVILDDISPENTEKIFEGVRQALQNADEGFAEDISFGIYPYKRQEAPDLEFLTNKADSLMYRMMKGKKQQSG